MHGVIPPQVQDFALTFADLDEVHVHLFSWPVQILWMEEYGLSAIPHPFVYKFDESAPCAIIQVISEEAKAYRLQYQPLEYTTGLQLDFLPLITTFRTQESS